MFGVATGVVGVVVEEDVELVVTNGVTVGETGDATDVSQLTCRDLCDVKLSRIVGGGFFFSLDAVSSSDCLGVLFLKFGFSFDLDDVFSDEDTGALLAGSSFNWYTYRFLGHSSYLRFLRWHACKFFF